MKERSSRPLLRAALVLALALSGAVAALQWRYTLRMRENDAWVAHTHAVKHGLVELLSGVQDIESGARGYAITGDPGFLAPFEVAVAALPVQQATLCRQVHDNPPQRQRCDALWPLIQQRLRLSEAAVKARRDGGLAAAQALVAAGAGLQAMNELRAALDTMQAEEFRLLGVRSAAAERDALLTRWSTVAGSAVSLVLLLAVFGWMLRENRLRLAAQAQRDRFFDLSLDLLCIVGTDGYFKQINPAFSDTLGFSAAELLARPFIDFVHPDDAAATVAEAQRLAEGGTTRHFENRYRTRSGEWKWLAWRAQPYVKDGLLYATGRDITELREATDALRASEENLAVTLQSIGDGVLATDAEGRVQRLNPVAEALTGWTEEEARGRPVEAVFHIVNEETRAPAFLPVPDTLAKGTLHGLANHTVLIARDGRECPIADSCAPIFGKDHAVMGAVLVFRDVTEESRQARAMQRLNAELAAASAAARSANQAKSDFLATMSHEIRTPMNGVIGMVDVLHQTSLTGPQVEMVDLIRESALSLLDVIEDILDFSKIEAGKLEVERAPMSLEDVAEKACGLLDQMARRKRVELRLFVDPALPPQVEGDALRVRQVLLNLVNNAIKFSGDAAPRPLVCVRAQPGPGGAVQLSVSDNGIGMDGPAQARLFQPFSQADVSTTRRYGGTGLGLAISRHLVELMGGHIEVASRPGEGATFTVTLPLPALPGVAEASAAAGLRGVACVVVGPRGGMADDWGRYLQHAGATVQRLADVGERAVLPDERVGRPVWLVDGPEPPPLETLYAAARRHGLDDAGWVVLLGGRDAIGAPYAEADPVLALDTNVLKRRTLLRAVAVAAGRVSTAEDEDDPRRHAAQSRPAPTRDEALRQGRLILVAEDNETNQEVIRRQLALLGHAADVARTGRMALDLWRSGDYGLLLTDLHMPELDGYELAAAIRHEERGGVRRPIIALSANALKDEAQRCEAAGMDGYLSKPAQLAQLKATLERWLPDVPAPPAAPPRQPLDLSALTRLIGDDPQVTGRVLQEFRSTGQEIARAMGTACRAGDTVQAATQAHKFKASAAAVGAKDLAELCRAIETAALAGRAQTLETLCPLFEAEWREVDALVARELATSTAVPPVMPTGGPAAGSTAAPTAMNRSAAATPSVPPA